MTTTEQQSVLRGVAALSCILRIVCGIVLVVMAATHWLPHAMSLAVLGALVASSAVEIIWWDKITNDDHGVVMLSDIAFMLLASVAFGIVGGKWWLGWAWLVAFVVAIAMWILMDVSIKRDFRFFLSVGSAVLAMALGSFAWPLAVVLRGPAMLATPILVVVYGLLATAMLIFHIIGLKRFAFGPE